MKCDVLVVGAGMAGLCAAIQAGRLGLKTILVEKEMLLGGNWGTNMGIGAVGALHNNEYFNEAGLVSEIENRLTREKARIAENVIGFNLNPKWEYVINDMLNEANVILLRKHLLYDVEVINHSIKKAFVKNIETLEDIEIIVSGFCIDASGDGHLAYKAGANFMIGRESKEKYNESFGADEEDTLVSAASLTAVTVDMGNESVFNPPPGTLKWNRLKPANSFNPDRKYNILFQIDEGGDIKSNHPLYSPQDLYMNLAGKMYSIWDYFKNDLYKEKAKTHQLIWISPILGKRESRRITGNYVLNQNDLEKCTSFEDAIAFGGFLLDEHPPSYDGGYETRFFGNPLPYDIPLRCIYSENVANLFMAGRNISVSHVVFTSSRVIRTGGTLGQAAAICAEYCIRNKKMPGSLSSLDVRKIQQNILYHDGFIIGVKAFQKENLINDAKLYASSEARLSNDYFGERYLLAKSGIGVCLYHIPAEIIEVSFYIRNQTGHEQEMTLSVGHGKTPDNVFRSTQSQNDEYSFRYPDRQDYIDRFDRLFDSSRKISAGFEGWVTFSVNMKFYYPCQRETVNQGLLLALSGDVEVRSGIKPLDVMDGMIFKNKWVKTNEIMAFKLSEEVYPGAVENIRNGKINREGIQRVNAWVSDISQALPQVVNIKFDTEKKVDRIVLRFDETLRNWFEMSHFSYGGKPERIISHYRVVADVNGQRKVLFEEKDNYFRFRNIGFKEVKTDMISVEVLDVHGEKTARIYDIGVYHGQK